MSVPPGIGSDEELGRHVFSHRHANRALRSTVPHHVFLIQEGKTRISVDRLSIAPAPAADREEQTRHAQELADASRWRPRPSSRV